MSEDSTADFAQAVVSAGADGGSASGARARRGERDARRRSDARGAKAPADLKTDGRRGRANRRRRAETDDDDEGVRDAAHDTMDDGSVHEDAGAQEAQMQMNSSFQSVSSLSASQDFGTNAGAEDSGHADGGLDDFGDFAAEPAAVEQMTAEVGQMAVEHAAPAEPAAPAPEEAPMEPVAVMSNAGSASALSESDFAAPEQSVMAEEPAVNMYNSPHLQAFRAEQAKQLAEREEAEKREIERIKEEAQAELELMDSQRAKQISSAKQANRERQTAEEELFANASGWEAVSNYVSDENLVPDSLTDLSKMRSLIRVLKNTPPVKSA